MRIGVATAVLACLVFWGAPAVSGDSLFPQTEEEIVEALSLKDANTVYEGVEYQSENGRVYKVINGKRYRMRGLGGIVDSDMVPRAAAIIQFDLDSSRIQPESYPILNEFGKAMQGGLSGVEIMIVGHTDSTGTDEYNQRLSEDRASSVARYLSDNFQIGPEQTAVMGCGEQKPIAGNDTEEGRAMNRRVEFVRAR